MQTLKQTLSALNYSDSTIKGYSHVVSRFLEFSNGEVTQDLIIEYLASLRSLGKSSALMSYCYSALKFYFTEIISEVFDLPAPRVSHKLPRSFTREEILKLLSVRNIKYRTLLTLIYSSGLRVGEAVQIRTADIDSQKMRVLIRESKNRKARYAVLSVQALSLLRQYYKSHKPGEFLFPGVGGHLAVRSAQNIFNIACKAAGLSSSGVHSLRHSFAVHALESGCNLYLLQQMLGHVSLGSTAIYLQTANLNFRSPFDV